MNRSAGISPRITPNDKMTVIAVKVLDEREMLVGQCSKPGASLEDTHLEMGGAR